MRSYPTFGYSGQWYPDAGAPSLDRAGVREMRMRGTTAYDTDVLGTDITAPIRSLSAAEDELGYFRFSAEL